MMKKTVLSAALALFLALPAAIHAQPLPKTGNVPEIGHATVFSDPPKVQLQSNYNYLWDANYEVTTYYRIPKEIKLSQGFTGLSVFSDAKKNTGDNSTYDISVVRFSTWAGGWRPVQTKSYRVGSFSSESFTGLSDGETYCIQIDGNVKGNLKVYEDK